MEGKCPNCGYCSHCGRSNHTLRPWPYYPTYPWGPVWAGNTSGTAGAPTTVTYTAKTAGGTTDAP